MIRSLGFSFGIHLCLTAPFARRNKPRGGAGAGHPVARTNGTENRIVRGCVGGVGRIAQRMHTVAWIQWASRGRSEAVKAKKNCSFWEPEVYILLCDSLADDAVWVGVIAVQVVAVELRLDVQFFPVLVGCIRRLLTSIMNYTLFQDAWILFSLPLGIPWFP